MNPALPGFSVAVRLAYIVFNDSGESYIDDVVIQEETGPVPMQFVPAVATRDDDIVLYTTGLFHKTGRDVYGREMLLPGTSQLSTTCSVADEHRVAYKVDNRTRLDADDPWRPWL